MAKELERLQVTIEADPRKLKQGAGEAKKSVKDMTASINRDIEKIKSPAKNMAGNETMAMLNNTKAMIKNTIADIKSGALGGAMADGIKDYVKEAQIAAGIKVYTDDYKQICADV